MCVLMYFGDAITMLGICEGMTLEIISADALGPKHKPAQPGLVEYTSKVTSLLTRLTALNPKP